tara:strand:- start:4064 stop:5713 length:1650 start_codon:yes stop_codon:yes gene_type:complete
MINKILTKNQLEGFFFKRPQRVALNSENLMATILLGRESIILGHDENGRIDYFEEVPLPLNPTEIMFIKDSLLMIFSLVERKLIILNVQTYSVVLDLSFDRQTIIYGSSQEKGYFLSSNDNVNFDLLYLCADNLKLIPVTDFLISDLKPLTFHVSNNEIFCCFENDSLKKIYKYGQETKLIEFATHGRGRGFVRSPQVIQSWQNMILVLDRDNYLCQAFDKFSLQFLTQFGGKGIDASVWDYPSGMFCREGKLFIADTNNDRVVRLDLTKNLSKVICSRKFEPAVLARPSAIVRIENRVYVCDRDNSKVQIFNDQASYVSCFPICIKTSDFRPCDIKKFRYQNSNCLAVLTRRHSEFGSVMFIFDFDGKEIYRKPLNSEGDPQGFVVTSDWNIVISDTLNRRALLYDNHLKLINKFDLASVTHEKFLCRRPFYIDDKVHFADYHGTHRVVLEPNFETFQHKSVDYSSFGIKHIRNEIRTDNGVIVLGRGETQIIYVSDAGVCYGLQKALKNKLNSPSDCISIKNNVVCLDKESDCIHIFKMSDFSDCIC